MLLISHLGAHLSLPDLGRDTVFGDLDTGDKSITIQSSITPKIWLSASDLEPLSLPQLLVDSIDFNYKMEIDVDEKADSSLYQTRRICFSWKRMILFCGSM